MRVAQEQLDVHPKGEVNYPPPTAAQRVLDTYGGVVRVNWDPEADVTLFGQMIFFVEFLKTAGLFDRWVEDCPLVYTSHHASDTRDILGTIMLSLLAGHKRYAHITSIRSDGVNPQLLGMSKVVSEDTVRRGLKAMSEAKSGVWLKRHLRNCCEPLLSEPWILDIDTTVKPLYGHQEGAVLGYNPQKPGRPSHVYHTYFIGSLRVILEVEVQPGNQTAALYTQPGLWSYLEKLPTDQRPRFLRGDCAFGNEGLMREAEKRGIDYLFKLKQSAKIKRLIYRAFSRHDWVKTGQGWEGVEEPIQLSGWSKQRRVIVLRRLMKEPVVIAENALRKQPQLAFIEMEDPASKYEYSVLVTSMADEIVNLAKQYRDRADIENVFDEMKNQWSWGGFTTHDLARSKSMARIAALVFNWWSLFAGLAFVDRHAEAITTRPLLLYAVGRQTRHAGQKRVSITSAHAEHGSVRKLLLAVSQFLGRIRQTAEQLSQRQRWRLILSRIFVRFLRGKILGSDPPKTLRLAQA